MAHSDGARYFAAILVSKFDKRPRLKTFFKQCCSMKTEDLRFYSMKRLIGFRATDKIKVV